LNDVKLFDRSATTFHMPSMLNLHIKLGLVKKEHLRLIYSTPFLYLFAMKTFSFVFYQSKTTFCGFLAFCQLKVAF